MAQLEPMDVENIGGEFDDKENSLHNSNVLPKTPSTEKGFEELDVSELNMKLRYSITPSNSPMSRSYTANCKADSGPNSLNNTVVIDNNLTRSLNTSVNKTDVLKAPKLPLQALPTSLFTNNDRTLSEREGNLTVTITGTENDDNLSLPSTSSSALHTPEATTPTKEIPKSDGSPIMRGLKSVLNMFRSSHSPVPPSEDEDPAKNGSSNTSIIASTLISSSTVDDCVKETSEIIPVGDNPHLETPAMDKINPQLVTSTSLYRDTVPNGQSNLLVASTPISNSKIKDSKNSPKRNSPLKESVVFNEDLERELQWQEETEIFFKYEKIPTHKLLFHTNPINIDSNQTISVQNNDMSKLNTTVEYMDVSNADISYKSVIEDKTLNNSDTKVVNTKTSGVESDEFLDCETTPSQNKSYILETAQENKASSIVFQTDIIPHEACLEDCIATTNKSNNISDDEITVDKKTTELIVSSTFETNNLISEKPVDDFILQDNALNFDTDDDNTNRILFKIDELLLNKINLENLKKDIVSNNNETKSEYKKASENLNVCLSNTSEGTLPDESRSLNDTVAISNNEETNVDLKNSIEINELSKITEELIENTLVPDRNIDDYNKFSISMKNSMEIKELDPQNMEVDKTSDFKMNTSLNDDSLHLSDKKEHISVMQHELNIVDDFKNNISDSTNVRLIVSQQQNIEGSQDITMDSLEPTLDLNNDQLTREINTTGIHEEVHYNSSVQNYNVTTPENNNELINNPLINVPLPLDVPLPSDDDIENDNLLNLCSIKNNTDMVAKIETEKTACVMVFNNNTEPKEAINCANLSKPFQSDNDRDPKISHSDSSNCVVEELQTNFNSGVEMASAENNLIQETPFSSISTNLPSGFQELKVDSNKKESQQVLQKTVENLNDTFTCSELVIKPEINVNTATEISHSDIVRAVNNTEQNNLSTQELKTDITNETVCLDFNMNSKVIDDEIMTSANNSPYVSVTELNLNSDIPVDQSENAPKPITEAVVSPPISPKLTRKGYNIDFDAIENPFATKTNVRMSPPPGTPSKTFTPINNQTNYEAQRRSPDRRRSQPESKKPHANKKRFNTSIDRVKIINSSKIKKSNNKVINTVHTEDNKTGEDKNLYEINNLEPSVEDIQKEISPSDKSEDDYSYTSTVVKTSPDLENQKILRKSNENNISTALNLNSNQETGSVFNITEFDDLNFNPFASKSRMCVTPPPTEVIEPLHSKNDIGVLTDFINENQFKTEQLNATVCIDNNVQDKINTTEQENATVCKEDSVQNEVKASINTSNSTYTSINTEDKDITVREVNTEDDDTIEGPFFEAEDLLDVVKVPEIEIEKETMQFEDLPTTSNNENLDKGELFIDAEAFEFLLNQNQSNVVADSGKESLFLKFDPLFAKRVSSDGVLAALSSIAKKQSTPKKLTRTPLVNLARAETPTMPVAGPSDVASMPEEIVTVAKPMMVVNPAVTKQPVATPRISLTPKTKRQSLNFTSPAMVVIDRLLSLSGNTSLLDHDDTTDANRNREANIVLVQLRELLAEKELHVYGLKCESNQLRERLTTLESQVKSLENEGEERLRKVNMLNERLVEKTKINKSMAVVVEEYERTIASLIAQIEQEKKQNAEERMKLINERDEQTAHLASMEGSFSDLHSKYEKCKQIILSMKANEDGYKKSSKQFDENLLKMQKNYDLLKQHATSKLNHANQELEKMNRAHEAEVLKLTAMIKRKDLHISSLEETLAQKKKSIEELTAICDELISKVG